MTSAAKASKLTGFPTGLTNINPFAGLPDKHRCESSSRASCAKAPQSKAPVPVIAQLARLLDSHRCLSGNPANGLMFVSPVGKPVNLDALAADVIVPLVTKAGVRWRGWHAFRRGLATNLHHRLGVSDKTIQRILRHSNVAVTQNCYIKTAGSEVAAAMQQFERSLEYAPNMHLGGVERKHLM